MLNYRDYAFSCYFAYQHDQSRLTHSSEMASLTCLTCLKMWLEFFHGASFSCFCRAVGMLGDPGETVMRGQGIHGIGGQ